MILTTKITSDVCVVPATPKRWFQCRHVPDRKPLPAGLLTSACNTANAM